MLLPDGKNSQTYLTATILHSLLGLLPHTNSLNPLGASVSRMASLWNAHPSWLCFFSNRKCFVWIIQWTGHDRLNTSSALHFLIHSGYSQKKEKPGWRQIYWEHQIPLMPLALREKRKEGETFSHHTSQSKCILVDGTGSGLHHPVTI